MKNPMKKNLNLKTVAVWSIWSGKGLKVNSQTFSLIDVFISSAGDYEIIPVHL